MKSSTPSSQCVENAFIDGAGDALVGILSRRTPDEPLIEVLHETADYLESQRYLKVIAFNDVGSAAFSI